MEEQKISYRAGAIVLNEKKQIALANEHLWGFPRGGVEPGEDYIATAIREVNEEVGITQIESAKKLGMYIRYPNGVTKDTLGAYPMEIHMFLFSTSQEDLIPADHNVKETGWFSYKEALEKLTDPEDKAFLKSKSKEIFEELD